MSVCPIPLILINENNTLIPYALIQHKSSAAQPNME